MPAREAGHTGVHACGLDTRAFCSPGERAPVECEVPRKAESVPGRQADGRAPGGPCSGWGAAGRDLPSSRVLPPRS